MSSRFTRFTHFVTKGRVNGPLCSCISCGSGWRGRMNSRRDAVDCTCVCVCVCVCALEVEVGGNNELGDPEEEWGGHNGREGRWIVAIPRTLHWGYIYWSWVRRGDTCTHMYCSRSKFQSHSNCCCCFFVSGSNQGGGSASNRLSPDFDCFSSVDL